MSIALKRLLQWQLRRGIFSINGKVTKPGVIAAFGNRITVSVANSSQFVLSAINLGGSSFNPATDRKSTRLNSSHSDRSRMPSSA